MNRELNPTVLVEFVELSMVDPLARLLAEAASIYIGVVPNGSVVVQLDLGASPARR